MRKNSHIGSDFDDFLKENGLWEDSVVSATRRLPDIHPGEVLLREFLVPMGLSRRALARAADLPPRRINEIVLGKRRISADTAVRLAAVLGTSERFWLGLQADHDLEQAHRALGSAISGFQRLPT